MTLTQCIFCEFAQNKRKNHVNGFPFNPVRVTENTMSFLSLDLPKTQDAHVLVIPKKHYANLSDIPSNILHEMVYHIKLISKVLEKTHAGCNLLLNDGKSAGQKVMHVHFHIIPRNKNDKIRIEVWPRKKITKDKFIGLNKKLKLLLN